jgi:hypothetical protein
MEAIMAKIEADLRMEGLVSVPIPFDELEHNAPTSSRFL